MFPNGLMRLQECFPASLFNKVVVNHRNAYDETPFMTMTMLLYNRVENLKITYTLDGATQIDNISQNPEVFSIHWFNNTQSNPDELLKQARDGFKVIDKLPAHEKFLSEKFNQKIWIRLMPNENTACIFAEKVSYQLWHYTQSFIPKYFKIFKEKPLTKEEIAFLETLTLKTYTSYTTKIINMASTQSFRNYVLKDTIVSFEKTLYLRKVKAAEEKLSEIERRMNRALEDYQKACQGRVEAVALVMGLKAMADQHGEHTEFEEYLMNNKRLCNITVNQSTISFIIKTYLAPHYIDDYETMTRTSTMFAGYVNNKFKSADDIKLLMDAIFSGDRCLRLKLCAYFSMDYFGSTVTSLSHYNYEKANSELKDYMPNPHLFHHNCLGKNYAVIVEQLKQGDPIGAIECATSCAQNIYIHDISFSDFISDLLDTDGKVLIAGDGTEMNPVEALKYLKERKHE